MAKVKDIYTGDLLPEGITISKLEDFYQEASREYARPLKRMKVLDGADKGRLWDVVKAKFPSYQILPDTNHTNFIKENLVSSIYIVGMAASLVPKSPDDTKFVVDFNAALDTIWDQVKAYKYQTEAGERAALLNLGITQVGWRKDILGGTDGHWYKGDVVFKNIDPMKFRRDPYAVDLDKSRYCYYYEDYSLGYIKTKKIYRQRIKEILDAKGGKLNNEDISAETVEAVTERSDSRTSSDYHRVTTYWVMRESDNDDGYKISEIHMLDNKYVLYVKEELKPNMYPFAMLYCNSPAGDLIGVSEPAKQFANSLTYNMISSIQATYAYKAQRPPKFVNVQAGINLRQFAKHGNDADATFPVNGDASTAVHYGIFPPLPGDLLNTKMNMANDIKDMTGINDRYTGMDTGSIQGTGGVDSMLTRATQRDLPKIQNYEEYTKRLAELVVNNLIMFGDKRKYSVKDPISQKNEEIELDFMNVSDDTRFAYTLNIQSQLPKNKARLAMIANMLLEKQSQYRPNPEIITVEEWLLMQDLPFSDLIFKRMGIQRNTNFTEQVAQTLTQFADMVDQGVEPDEAIDAVAQTLQNQQVPNKLGNTGGFQMAQMGSQMQQEPQEGMDYQG